MLELVFERTKSAIINMPQNYICVVFLDLSASNIQKYSSVILSKMKKYINYRITQRKHPSMTMMKDLIWSSNEEMLLTIFSKYSINYSAHHRHVRT